MASSIFSMPREENNHRSLLHLRAGLELRARGQLTEAAARLGQAVAADPAQGAGHSALAAVLIACGRHPEAVPHVEAALALDPDDVEAQHCLGLLFLERALFEPAVAAFGRCIALDANFVDAWRNLAVTQRALGRPDAARVTIERALSRSPDKPGLRSSLAAICEFFGEHERVLELLEPRVAAGQHGIEELLTLTTSLQVLDRVAEARRLLQSALLAEGTEQDERYRVEFALGNLLDRAGEYEKAFAQVRRANAGKRARFESESHGHYVDSIMDGFRRLRRPGTAGSDSDRPVFIVGMPRSGTSLLEQIVSAHPEVAGAGELPAIPLLAQTAAAPDERPRPGGLHDLSAARLVSLADAYLVRLERIDPTARHVTDKMWENFEYLGFIERLFPRARVIHCRRDPRDVAISCYFQHFAGSNRMAFAYDLAHIGAFYRGYERLMAFWRRESTLEIMDVRYEDIVRDLEKQARRAIAFLELDWSPACLNFYDSSRIVNTASYAQVRRPLYASSIGRWRHYAGHLQPFAEAAGLELQD